MKLLVRDTALLPNGRTLDESNMKLLVRDTALLPNGRTLDESNMKLLVRDTAFVGYELLIWTLWIQIFQTVKCSVLKCAETVNISNVFKLYSLRWNIFMYKWSRKFLFLSLKQAKVAHQQGF